MLVRVITEIGDSRIFRLNLVGHAENGGNGRKRRWHQLTVNPRIVLRQLNHPSRRTRHPPRQRTRRAHLVLAPTGTRHNLASQASTTWQFFQLMDLLNRTKHRRCVCKSKFHEMGLSLSLCKCGRK